MSARNYRTGMERTKYLSHDAKSTPSRRRLNAMTLNQRRPSADLTLFACCNPSGGGRGPFSLFIFLNKIFYSFISL